MWVKVVGIQEMDFQTQDNRRLQGYKFHIIYKNPRVEGRATNTINIFNGGIGYNAALTTKVGDKMFVSFNEKGKCDYFGFENPDEDMDI